MKKEVRLSQLQTALVLALPFQLAWLLAALLVFLADGTIKFSLIAALIPVLWAPTLLELVTKTKIPTIIQLHFHIFVSASAVAGTGFGLYGLVPEWDTIVHFYSGVIFIWLGLFTAKAVERKTKHMLPRWFAVIVALAISLSIAAIWEVYEFACDTFFGTTMQAGGLEDTMVDTLAAGAGSAVALLIAMWTKAPKDVVSRSMK